MSTKDDELGMEGLTPEERAALKIDDGDTTATQGELEDKAAAGGATEGDDDDAASEDDAGSAGASAAADDGATAAAKDDDGQPAAADAEPAGTPSAAQAPLLVVQAPEDADAKLAEIATKKADLRKQYDDGDLTFDEYEAQKESLDEQRLELKLQIDKANLAAEMEQQRRKNEWDSQCTSFLKAHAEYEGGKGERFEHLNETLKAIAVMPRNAGLTGPELLEKAHKLVLAERGESAPAPAAKQTKQEIPKSKLPPDIGALPSASSNDPGEGKWASLDRLQGTNPEAYEAALAKMSDADRDAYLAA